MPPGDGYPSYTLELIGAYGEAVETVAGLTRNSYGALAASAPAAKLVAGDYRARLSGLRGES